jgi:hypothetical protein
MKFCNLDVWVFRFGFRETFPENPKEYMYGGAGIVLSSQALDVLNVKVIKFY